MMEDLALSGKVRKYVFDVSIPGKVPILNTESHRCSDNSLS